VSTFETTFTDAGYEGLVIVPELQLSVEKSELAVILGSNGAGKSTTLRAIMGLVQTKKRSVKLDGEDLSSAKASLLPRHGVILVPDGARCFADLTITENLEGTFIATQKSGDHATMRSCMSEVFDLFPILYEKRDQFAGTMSGGQRQMLAVGRALMATPRVMLLDEPTAGLAPKIVEQMFTALARIKAAKGCSILMAEQNVAFAQHIADRCVIIESGRLAAQGPMGEMAQSQVLREAYLGM
jgi:branched-chain amino acid transport system ATP-binding protein